MAAPELFLLTPLREGRLDHVRQLILAEVISTHAPAGGATTGRSPGCRKESISTHAPAGGATSAAGQSKSQFRLFLLTPLREGRPEWCEKIVNGRKFLLTPLREGRPVVREIFGSVLKISTHAPAGGAT